ncbi:DUF262 domain-containing protein [Shewanella algae]|uniref:DUF262 domain-containing protein n=1 Tax=Shewanella algae TaxID=38313 RepID=UPI000BB63C73|nr:DUF262 domain-containing protein [Shewanella algae]EKT4486905.1 DUF262 domain-containing protein [Shewanella algae]MBO2547467.1 DUF262 domain-containing protein [Shewanella algae]MBO2556330.1 DUF262 domain-containing protein [Shewanella algae]MBO2573263.1 DUF262 domain-containing protein [Shewanella algae]PBQ28384.1 hypothetical protein AYI97_04825 [Shewanella algae]
MSNLENEILSGRNSLSADRLDMSFGELMNMYSNDELVIDPEFQRLFRWDFAQRSRFIESILLGIPIPSIFVAEDTDGRWEIVDGLQRLSTILSYFGMLKHTPEKNGWALVAGDVVESLEGLQVADLPIKYQLNIKRSVCRIEVVKWDSNYDMRYELFNRLNTGGSPLTDQEIRNCIFRGISVEFTNLIKQLSSKDDFVELIQPTQKQKDELYLDELVLRFFSLFQNHEKVNKNLSDHMTEYMKMATRKEVDYEGKMEAFNRVVEIVRPIGRSALSGKNGQLSTSLYDGVFNGVAGNIDYYEKAGEDKLREKIEALKEDDEFKKVSGVASNYKERVKKRIERAIEVFAPNE